MIPTTRIFAEPPYVGPRSFTEREPLYGRDREARELAGLLVSSRIVLLYSPSGAGKTSLLQARVIPDLRAREFTVLPVLRVGLSAPDAPGNRYLASLHLSLQGESASTPPPSGTFGDTLARLPGLAPDADVVLIFDQFEEVLTLDPTDIPAKQAFFRELGAALRPRNRWALFAMREDYVAALDPYLPLLPTRLACSYRLDLLDATAAGQAIRLPPLRERGVTIEPEAVSRLVDDLRRVQVQDTDGAVREALGPYVEPVQLQVVCTRLWREWVARRGPDDQTITVGDLGAVANVDTALREYYDGVVAEVAAAGDPPPSQRQARERALREWFDDHLITPEGVRGLVLQDYPATEGLPNADVYQLVDAYLVRAERRGGRTWFELAHDRLIRPVQASNADWKRANLVPAQVQARLWEAQGRPDALALRGEQLREAAAWAARSDVVVTPLERQFLDRCAEVEAAEERERRRTRLIRRLGVGLSVAGLLAIGLALFALAARNEATARQLGAQASQALAASPPRALLLASESLGATAPLSPLPDATSALYGALAASGGIPPGGHQARVNAVAFSPDSAILASAGRDRAVRLWRPGNLAAPPALLAHPGEVLALAFSPDGQLLATAATDNAARLWRVSDPTAPPIVLRGREAAVTTLAFSPDGTTLASGSGDGSVRLWRVSDPAAPPIVLRGHEAALTALAFSPDGRLLATAAAEPTVLLWEPGLADPQPRRLEGHEAPLTTLAFSPDGATLASADRDGTARIWSLGDDSVIALRGHTGRLNALAFSPDGATLATAGRDGDARLWDLSASPPGATLLRGHQGALNALRFSPDGSQILTASDDGRARLWPLADPTAPALWLAGHESAVTAAAFSPDGASIATGASDGTVRLWQTATLGPVPVLRGPGQPFVRLAFGPDGGTLSAADPSGGLLRWNLNRLNAAPALVREPADGTLVALSTDGQTLVTAAFEAPLLVWGLEPPGTAPGTLGDGSREVLALALSPDGRQLAVAYLDGGVTRFSLAEPGAAQELPPTGAGRPLLALAFSPDGTTLAGGGDDSRVYLWDLEAGGAPASLDGHTAPVLAVAFSPDGATLASGGGDATARLWNPARGQTRAVLRGHRGNVNAVAFSPDGQTLATAGEDGTARLWSTRTPTRTPVVLPGHERQVNALAFSPDGQTLATTGDDGRVRLWPLDIARLPVLACATAGRNLHLGEWEQAFGARPYARTCSQLPISPTLVETAAALVAARDPALAAALIARVAQLDAQNEVPARAWAELCRAESLANQPRNALASCDRAIALDPTDGLLYDRRALARALTGDLAGAADDLAAYLAWAGANGEPIDRIAARQDWAAQLAAGSNPFDAATLQTIREE